MQNTGNPPPPHGYHLALFRTNRVFYFDFGQTSGALRGPDNHGGEEGLPVSYIRRLPVRSLNNNLKSPQANEASLRGGCIQPRTPPPNPLAPGPQGSACDTI